MTDVPPRLRVLSACVRDAITAGDLTRQRAQRIMEREARELRRGQDWMELLHAQAQTT